MRVLIVDDNPDCLKSMGLMVSLWGHETHLVGDGPSALAAVTAFQPEAALLDIGLPGMSGWELAPLLKKSRDNLLLVAITGYGQESDRQRSDEAGFFAHLTKPANLEQLERMLAWWSQRIL